MPKTCYFLTSTFSRSCIDFGGSWASKLEPNWPSWAPRALPKASKIQSFGSMCPRCFPRGPKVAPRASQGGSRSRFSEDFRQIWEAFFVIFGCENSFSQPKLHVSYVLAEWRHHLKSTYSQTSSHMSKEGRRYVRSTKNCLKISFGQVWGSIGEWFGTVQHWSKMGSKRASGSILDGFGEGFGRILGGFWDICSTIFWFIFENCDFVKLMVSPQ